MALEVTCPGPEAALALVGAARRLGIPAKAREVRGVDRVVDPRRRRDRRAAHPARRPRQSCWPGRSGGCAARCGPRPTGWPTSTTPTCAARPGPRSPPAPGCSGPWRSSATTSPTTWRRRRLRLEHKQAVLEELGQLADPPLTKDAVAGRIRRLLAMADKRASRPRHPGHRGQPHRGHARRGDCPTPRRARWADRLLRAVTARGSVVSMAASELRHRRSRQDRRG